TSGENSGCRPAGARTTQTTRGYLLFREQVPCRREIRISQHTGSALKKTLTKLIAPQLGSGMASVIPSKAVTEAAFAAEGRPPPPIPESIGGCGDRRSTPDGTSPPASCPCAPAPELCPCLRSRSLPRLRPRVRSSEPGLIPFRWDC